MKFRVFTVFLAAILLLTGCSAAAAGNALENGADALAGAVENAAAPASNQAQTTPATISREEAQAIALTHAGFTADQVSRLRTEYEIDDGVPRYEVQFRQGRWEYDYEINANTGAILSYDRDD